MTNVTHLVAQCAITPKLGALDADNNPYSVEELQRLEAMNVTYTHVVASGKNRVVSQKPCPVNGKVFVFESLDEFRNQFTHQPKIGGKRPGSAWVDWPGKNFCQGGIGIYPDTVACPATVFNLYPGLALEPKVGDCSPFLEHIRDVICGGNKVVYDYFIGWLAHIVQCPEQKSSVAILLKSVEGTGKGTVFKPLKSIFGQLAIQVNGTEPLTAKFNSLLANKLLVFADEVELTDSRRINQVKGLISEATTTIEYKGIDAQQVPNFARFIFAGNSERMIRAGVRERRYLLLEPKPDKAQNKAYFDRLHRWIDDDGAMKLLQYLLSFDLQDFDPRRAPVTRGLIEEKLSSLGSIDSYLYEMLDQKEPFGGAIRLETRSMVDGFVMWSRDNNLSHTAAQARPMMGKAMQKMGATKVGRSDRGDGHCYYELPAVTEMRSRFAAHLGHNAEEIFNVY